ncbi:MAG: DUF4214 domain-containing protein [Christensenellaceae bacterium]
MKKRVLVIAAAIVLVFSLCIPVSFAETGGGLAALDTATSVDGFVERLYTYVLERPSDPDGKAGWAERLVTGKETGTAVAYGFFFSDEMESKNLSDEEYIDVLYRALLGREPDDAGKADWVRRASAGGSRRGLFAGFVNSAEFAAICGAAGVEAGVFDAVEPRDENPQAAEFVERFYRILLGRKADAAGLNEWCSKIHSGQATGADVAYGFYFSDELENCGLSDEDFIAACWEAFYGIVLSDEDKDPNNNVMQGWVSFLQGEEPYAHFWIFAGSDDFAEICDFYGIERGILKDPVFSGDSYPE